MIDKVKNTARAVLLNEEGGLGSSEKAALSKALVAMEAWMDLLKKQNIELQNKWRQLLKLRKETSDSRIITILTTSSGFFNDQRKSVTREINSLANTINKELLKARPNQ